MLPRLHEEWKEAVTPEYTALTAASFPGSSTVCNNAREESGNEVTAAHQITGSNSLTDTPMSLTPPQSQPQTTVLK